MAGVPYMMYADGRLVKEGKTGGDGKLEGRIPPAAGGARIVLDPGTPKERTIDLNIRGMDPIEEIPGVCKRLDNLGFPCPVEEKITPAVADALRVFQRKNGLEPTGEADGNTRDLLKKAHGS
jgi:type VI secretion system secreted protein VgrG